MAPSDRSIICAGIYFDGFEELTFTCCGQNEEDNQLANDLVTIRLCAPDMDIDHDLFPTADSYLDHTWTALSSLLCYYFDQEEVLRVPFPAFTNDPDEEELPAEFLSLLGI